MRRTWRLAAPAVGVFLLLLAASGLRATGQAPAGVPQPSFRNIEILAGVSAEEMRLIMEAMNRSLGVECGYCHVPGSWHLDDRPAKQKAREMMRMVAEASETGFETLETPSCWTCHRGSRFPEIAPNALDAGPMLEAPAAAFSDEARPSGEVYANIEVLGDLPADRLRGVMIDFSRALGVGCAHCHVAGDRSSDARVTKPLARRMLEIERGLESDFFGGRSAISCWTCHRGQRTPETSLP